MLKTAIIGMGKMGRIRRNALRDHGGFEVTTVCDRSTDRLNDSGPAATFLDWRKAIEQELDAVVVCTTNDLTADVVCAALGRGLHVLAEKPPGRDLAELQGMIAAEKAAGDRVLKFGFNHRFHGSVLQAKQIIESGRLGRLLWARGIYGKAGGNYYRDCWRAKRATAGGGILLDQGIHMVDLLLHFLGEFTEVKSFVKQLYWHGTEVEDNAFALLRTADDQVAMLHSSATHWRHRFSLDLCLEEGYVCLDGILSSTRSYGEETLRWGRRQFEQEASAFGRPEEHVQRFGTDNSWALEIEDFDECIAGRREKPVGSSADAMRVMKTVGAIYSAAASPDGTA